MNSDIVKPMPATQETPCGMRHDTSAGSAATPARQASHAARVIPAGLPTARPAPMAPAVARSRLVPPRTTPAFANAKIGITTNALRPCSACSRRSSGAETALLALSSACSASCWPLLVMTR